MRTRCIPELIFLFSLLVFTFPALALTTENFKLGMRYFDEGNYPEALNQFKQAETEGLSNSRLTYNLASVYYKLKQYPLSKKYFNRLTQDENLAFQANYSLGLIEYQLGNNSQAVNWFSQSWHSTTNPKLKALARKQIDTLNHVGEKNWFGFVSASFGYDTNIGYAPSSSVSNQSGALAKMIAYADWDLSDRIGDGIHASATYFSNDYLSSNDYDDDAVFIAAEYQTLLRDWDVAFGLTLGRSTYSNTNYLSTTAVGVRANSRLSKNKKIRIELSQEEVSSRSSQFSFLDGNKTEVNLEIREVDDNLEYRFKYGIELNQRRNAATASFSPTRYQAGARVINRLSEKYRVGAEVGYRLSEYDAVANQNRSDKRLRIKFDAHYKIDADWTGKLELIYLNNRSTETGSEYSKNMLLVSIFSVF